MPARKGFTLIELLVVMAILGILSVIGIVNFQSARLKARDAKRKSDLQTIAKSLEAYANDYQVYPPAGNGQLACCAWGEAFTDPLQPSTIYAAKLPVDDLSPTQDYQYVTSGTSAYYLYAHLENNNDPAIDPSISVSCGTPNCNYKITSSNLQ